MEENENRQEATQQEEARQEELSAPVYANMERYSNPYGGTQNQNMPYAEAKPVRTRKKHPVLKRLALSIVCGVIFGLFAGLGVYVVYELAGVGESTSHIAQLETQLDGLTSKVDALSGQHTAQSDTASTGIEPKPRDIELEGTNEETKIGQVETTTVTAVVTDVTEVVKSAMPCVVSITNLYSGTDWYGELTQEEASGSGIIVGETDAELLIVTNYHVIEGSDELSVQFIDDEVATAYVKGTDAGNDLAVITVFMEDIAQSTRDRIAIATLGDSDALQVGEPAIAIGNSLGYGQSVTTGVISALNREVVMDNNTSYLIQTDAAINPGNSGGALLNVKGEVIGINSNKIANYVIEGMGYAIPITTAKPVIEDLMQHETRKKAADGERAFLGISGKDMTSDVAAAYDIPQGVYVAEVLEDSAAQSAGILKGDIITALDGETITTMSQLSSTLEYYTAGTVAEVTLMRHNGGDYTEMTFTVTLGARTD